MTILQVLPEGFALPPLPYLVVLVAGVVAVGVGATRRAPALDGRHVLAFVPWILAGSCVHVLYVVDALPALLRPLGGTPAVYLTVAVVGGVAWLAADAGFADGTVPRALGVAGITAFVAPCAAGIAVGLGRGTFAPFWSAVALAVSLVVGAAAWWLLRRVAPGVEVTGAVGALAVIGHALDGVSTAVGTTQLGFGERTPVSRILLEVGGLPSVPVLGDGWLFLLVKLVVATAVVWLFAAYVRETPAEGFLLLGFVAAMGLGPAAHNLLLFSVAA